MEHQASLDSFLDSLAAHEDGDMLAFMALEEQFATLPIPTSLPAFRKLRKKLMECFDREYREAEHRQFLVLLGSFAGHLQTADERDCTSLASAVSGMETAIQEYLFDRVHQRQDGLYPADYFGNLVEDPDMLRKFVEEAVDHLHNAQLLLLDIEKDPQHEESLNTLFRAFHTIKGSAGFLGIKNLEDLAHEYESLLSLVREGRLRLAGTEIIDILFYAIKYIEDLVEVIPACGYEPGAIRESYLVRDIAPLLNLARNICHQFETRKIGEILLEMGSIAPDLVNDILRKQRETGRLFGEIATGDGLVPPEDINRAIRVQKTQKDQSAMVKVSAARLNAFVDLAGELVIIQSMIREGLKAGDMAGVERTREQLESISTGLKELALAMGMVGVSDLYNRLRIVVRNTAKDLGRLVDFSVSGEETELDRKLVEALYDPLVHMVRNAIDHGIEAPAERSASHKNATGTLSISASPKSNGIEIVVEDDGRGIDPEVLVAKALARGFITEEKARACRQNPQDAYKLLYLPGFSTKDQVSGVSGRGVGMDVVKTNVESIGGRMEIWSKPGKGTRFSIRIPLSLAIIEGFVCTIRARKFVFPFASLEEILVWPPEGKQAEHVQTQGNGRIIIRYRNDFLPVTDARRVFRFGDDDPVPRQRPLLVLRQDEHLFGLLVDEAIGQQEIVIKSLDEIMDRLPCLSGGSIFGDGSIGFVVNMDELAETLVEQRSMPKGHE